MTHTNRLSGGVNTEVESHVPRDMAVEPGNKRNDAFEGEERDLGREGEQFSALLRAPGETSEQHSPRKLPEPLLSNPFSLQPSADKGGYPESAGFPFFNVAADQFKSQPYSFEPSLVVHGGERFGESAQSHEVSPFTPALPLAEVGNSVTDFSQRIVHPQERERMDQGAIANPFSPSIDDIGGMRSEAKAALSSAPEGQGDAVNPFLDNKYPTTHPFTESMPIVQQTTPEGFKPALSLPSRLKAKGDETVAADGLSLSLPASADRAINSEASLRSSAFSEGQAGNPTSSLSFAVNANPSPPAIDQPTTSGSDPVNGLNLESPLLSADRILHGLVERAKVPTVPLPAEQLSTAERITQGSNLQASAPRSSSSREGIMNSIPDLAAGLPKVFHNRDNPAAVDAVVPAEVLPTNDLEANRPQSSADSPVANRAGLSILDEGPLPYLSILDRSAEITASESSRWAGDSRITHSTEPLPAKEHPAFSPPIPRRSAEIADPEQFPAAIDSRFGKPTVVSHLEERPAHSLARGSVDITASEPFPLADSRSASPEASSHLKVEQPQPFLGADSKAANVAAPAERRMDNPPGASHGDESRSFSSSTTRPDRDITHSERLPTTADSRNATIQASSHLADTLLMPLRPIADQSLATERAVNPALTTDPLLPSGDRILQGLFFRPETTPAAPAETPTNDGKRLIADIADRLAERILVSDRFHASTAEVRIQLRESILQGAEIVIRQDQGQLVVSFNIAEAQTTHQFSLHADELQRTLMDKLDRPVRVEVNTASGDSPGQGSPGDGRSRNRREFPDEWDSDS